MLDESSVQKLTGVHPDLVRVVNRAAEAKDIAFVVTEGVRAVKRQRELIAAGASTTLRSRHLTGHAVDLAVKVGDEVRWDWPLYAELAEVVKRAARQEGVTIEWGGDWRSFKDGPHFQLPWSAYPL
jgi:peptidoglycan L-alanyl-D-glutamate endopeptidase CwlK